MKTFTIELPSSLSINLKKNGNIQLDLEDKSPEWLEWAISMGVRQSCSDADASLKEAPDSERAEAIMAKFKKVNNGAIPAGGGSRHTPEELGFLAALRQKKFALLRIETGELTPAGKKKTKAEPIQDALERYVESRAEEYEIEVSPEVSKIVLDELREFDSFKLAAGIKKDGENDALASFIKKQQAETEEEAE